MREGKIKKVRENKKEKQGGTFVLLYANKLRKGRGLVKTLIFCRCRILGDDKPGSEKLFRSTTHGRTNITQRLIKHHVLLSLCPVRGQ